MKRRFPILAKVIILGIGVSILAAGVSMTLSYINQRKRSEEILINGIDNTLDEAEFIFTDEGKENENEQNIETIRGYIEPIFNDPNVEKKKQEDFPTFSEFVSYYASKYPWVYPRDGQIGSSLGLSAPESAFRLAFYSVMSVLNNFQMSSGGISVFLAFNTTYNNMDTMVMMSDSRMDRIDTKNSEMFYHVPGSFYQIKDTDHLDNNPRQKHRGYTLAGYRTRFIGIYNFNDQNEKQNEIARLYIEYDFTQIHKESQNVLRNELLIIGFSSLILVAIYTVFSYLLFVKNIDKLSKTSSTIRQRLIDKQMNEVVEIPIKSNDEMKVLADSLIDMEKAIINYVNIIHHESEERERANAELAIASKIQLDSLPQNRFEDKNVSIRSYIKTAKEVGGDFYDYFYLDNHRLVVLISDVSGKGIPASLFMMKGKELFKSALLSDKTLVESIMRANDLLTINNKELLFITSFIAVIDFEKNEIRYVNSGQEKPYIVSKGKVIKLDGESNIILGVESGFHFKEESHPFNEGDYLFMFTDGLNEAINHENEEFGYERIESTLRETNGLSLDNVLVKINENLELFTSGKEQFDDITMIIAKHRTNKLDLHYEKKDYEIIPEIVDKFNDEFSFLSSETKASVGIIIDEIVNNYISYEKREDLVIDVKFKLAKDGLEIEFSSNGEDYNPFANHKEKYLKGFSHDITPGGFGLSIIKDLSKSYDYKYKDGYSIITIVVAC